MSRYTNTPSILHLCPSVGGALLSFPFVDECSGCGNETTVTRGDARGHYPDPGSLNALDVVLEQRGWVRGEVEEMLLCPECAGGQA